MNTPFIEQAREIINLTVPNRPHLGFYERQGALSHQLRQQLIGAVATTPEASTSENVPLQIRLAEVGEQHTSELTTFNAVRSLDNYLYNHQWQYERERQEEHQEEALHDILDGLAAGHNEGHVEAATSTGKNYEIAKLAEAFYLGGLRVLILSHTNTIAAQNRHGKIIDGEPQGGLAKFAPNIPDEHIGEHFGKKRAKVDNRVVVSTYPSLNFFAKTGELGEFDVILADEAHRSLGLVTAENMRTFSRHAVKIGFTATPTFGVNKSVHEIFPYCYHQLPLLEAIERGLTAPVQPLLYATGVEIPDLDPRHSDFTPRELWRLANLKSRNDLAARLAKSFVQEGRQGIIPCLPGEDLMHARLMAELISRETIVDTKTGETRPIVARAVGNFLGDELQVVLQAFERGEIDVLTYVKVIGEGWDSQVASFLINTCPTTSLVKIIQDLGRIIRKKPNGLHSIAVDIVDEAVGKEQKTILHALGQERVELGKVYSGKRWSLGMDSYTYLRGLLYSNLYDRLQAVDGMLLTDLTLKPRERQRHVRLQEYYDRLLTKEGLKPNTHPMGVPEPFLNEARDYVDEYVEVTGEWPSKEELVEYLTGLDNTKIKIPKKDFEFNVERAVRALRVVPGGLLFGVVDDTENWAGRDPEDVVMALPWIKRETIGQSLAELDEREREILELRYGLRDGKPKNLEEVGEHFNLHRERIRQIEARAMSKLRWPQSGTSLRDLLREPRLGTSEESEYFFTAGRNWPVKDWNKYLRWRMTGTVTKRAYSPHYTEREYPRAETFSHDPLPFVYEPGVLSPGEREAQSQYVRRLQETIRKVREYADIADPIVETIAYGIYGNESQSYRGGTSEARRIINEGLMTATTPEGQTVQRQAMHNNWELKRRCLQHFSQQLPELVSDIQTDIQQAIRQAFEERGDAPYAYANEAPTVWDARGQASNKLVEALRQIADEFAEESTSLD